MLILKSNQIDYNLDNTEWFRNTTPYGLNKNSTYYDFLFQPTRDHDFNINVTNVSTGDIQSVGILTGGTNYQVNDEILFEPLIGAQEAKAKGF